MTGTAAFSGDRRGVVRGDEGCQRRRILKGVRGKGALRASQRHGEARVDFLKKIFESHFFSGKLRLDYGASLGPSWEKIT